MESHPITVRFMSNIRVKPLKKVSPVPAGLLHVMFL